MENIIVTKQTVMPGMMSIEDFIKMKKHSNLSENDINWQIKGYIHKIIDKVEEETSNELDIALNQNIITNVEWFDAHSLFNTLWFEMKRIISDMWFENQLMKKNAEEIFMRKAKDVFMNFESGIESSKNLKNFLQ